MACVPIISWQIEEEKVEAVTDFLFLGSKITGDGDCSHEIRRQLLLVRKAVSNLVVVVQWLSHVWLLATTCTVPCQATLSITVSGSLLKLMSIELVMPSNHLILCHPLLLPSSFPSIQVFSSESALLIRWPEYWSFSSSISPSNEYLGLVSFRMDWLDLLQSKGLSRVFSNTTVQKHQFFGAQLFYGPTLISVHDYWKNHSFD